MNETIRVEEIFEGVPERKMTNLQKKILDKVFKCSGLLESEQKDFLLKNNVSESVSASEIGKKLKVIGSLISAYKSRRMIQ